MTLRRLLVLLATLAALIVAPLPVSAAPPNQLLDPGVSPAAGDASTTFTFSVRYVSTGGNPATGVTATVAGQPIGLALVAGSATNGTWAGSATLPPGTWEVRFGAVTDRGPSPTASGPTLTVAGASSPSPAPSTPDKGGPPSATAPALAPSGEPPQPSSSTPEPAPASASAAPSTGDGSGSGAPAGGGGSGPGAAGGGGGGSQSVTGTGIPTASGSAAPAPAGSAAAAPSTGAAPAEGGAGSPNPDTSHDTPEQALPWVVLGTALATVAAVALLGLLWIVRRRGDEAGRRAALEAAEATVDELEARLAERMIRRARLRATSDPILSAMGLDETDDPDGRATPDQPPRRNPSR